MKPAPCNPSVPNSEPTPTLSDMVTAIESHPALADTRRRDLRSAVKRVADLLGEDPARVKLDLPSINGRLAAINPIAVDLSPKRWSNLRSDFLAAVKESGLRPSAAKKPQTLGPEWQDLLARAPNKRTQFGLSRLAHFASANGIAPAGIDDAAISTFIAAVREGSLHSDVNRLHRTVTAVWNKAASLSDFNLKPVTVPSFRAPARRIEWMLLSDTFRKNVDQYLDWCAGVDPFDDNARARPLAPATRRLRRDQIHAAVTALVESGVAAENVTSLADLMSASSFKSIMLRRLAAGRGRPTSFNRDLAEALVQIAREWVKVDETALAELKRLVSKVPLPDPGLTDKNKRALRQFDDPAVLQRLFNLPKQLWAEVKRDQAPSFRTLAKAQVALGVELLCYTGLRGQNLAALAFDTHLFLREGPGAISSLELNASEVKNDTELAFDIPTALAKMLIEYRNRIAPKIIGRRPEHLFVNPDGTPKNQKTVADLITRYLKKRAGIILTPHQFRHLSAKLLLDDQPGNFETVRQLLGHKSLKTTVAAYTGIDSRRAARHHQRVVERALAEQTPSPTRRGRRRGDVR